MHPITISVRVRDNESVAVVNEMDISSINWGVVPILRAIGGVGRAGGPNDHDKRRRRHDHTADD